MKQRIFELMDMEVLRRISHGVTTQKDLEIVMKNYNFLPQQIGNSIKRLIISKKLIVTGKRPRIFEISNDDIISSISQSFPNLEQEINEELKNIQNRKPKVSESEPTESNDIFVKENPIDSHKTKDILFDSNTPQLSNGSKSHYSYESKKYSELILKLNTGEEVKVSAKKISIKIHNDDIDISCSGE